MKYSYRAWLIVIILFLTYSVKAQIPTIGQIFNYNISDEFHFKYYPTNNPPEGTRSKVIDKYYSQNQDTLIYIMKISRYTTTFNPSPTPHLDYTFYNYIDTAIYTDLDSSIYYYLRGNPFYSNFNIFYYHDTNYIYCQNDLHYFHLVTNGNEPDEYYFDYSIGLGNVSMEFWSHSSYPLIHNYGNLVYYKKGSFTCGTADTVGLSINLMEKANSINVFPNPVKDRLSIQITDFQNTSIDIQVINNTGQIIKEYFNFRGESISTTELSDGLYLIRVSNGKIFGVKKFIVKH